MFSKYTRRIADDMARLVFLVTFVVVLSVSSSMAEADEAALVPYCEAYAEAFGSVTATCTYHCALANEGSYLGTVDVAGGNLGVAIPQVSGSNECGPITCSFIAYCTGSGPVTDTTSDHNCIGTNNAAGVAYSNVIVQCYNQARGASSPAATGNIHYASEPNAGIPQIGDVLCVSRENPQCVMLHDDGVAFVAGSALSTPFGVGCQNGQCVLAIWR
jgi:hypothetical protein